MSDSLARSFFPQGHLTSMTMTRRRLRKDRRNAFVATAAANLGHKSRAVKNFRLAAICQSCGPDELDRLLRLDGFCKPNYHESETEGRTHHRVTEDTEKKDDLLFLLCVLCNSVVNFGFQ